MSAPAPPMRIFVGKALTRDGTMKDARQELILEILADATELSDEERGDYIEERCGGDTTLLAEVRSMLRAWTRAESYFESPVAAPVSVEDWILANTPEGAPAAPGSIGPYQLLEVLGSGGMGVVWLAEQREPITRRVALKIIKLGMDTREVVSRFESERQALALMDHPGIARVLDAGATEAGRPFFVMELVEGEPIHAYCDRHRLSTTERIRLFVAVCSAVQHAHMKGVVHRDLKPSNILVSTQGGRPVPKVIDFGIAKAVSGDMADRTHLTTLGQIVGTPAYMSPEQASGAPGGVDTRTDVYALGVILYELLVGTLPMDLRGVADHAILAAILDTQVPRPSSRLTSLGAEREQVAAYRQTSPDGLRRALRDDLDWIVLKAMAKEPQRRFDSASAFAQDLERHLRSEPVTARPPSAAYRVGKFTRRHRFGVAALATAFGLLGAFGATVTVQSSRLARERDKAVEVSRFLEDLFTAPDPYAAASTERPDTMRVREFMRLGAARVSAELGDQPAVLAHMLLVLGKVYRNWGEYDEARPLLERSLDLRHDLYEPDDPEVLGGKSELGLLLLDQGELEGAETLLSEVVAVRTAAGNEDRPAQARVLQALGNVYQESGEFDAAHRAYVQATELLTREFGPGDVRVAGGLGNVGTALLRKGDLRGAEAALRQALAIHRAGPDPDHPNAVTALNNLATVLEDLGELEESEAMHREALRLRRARFGDVHPAVARSLNNLANVMLARGDSEGAESGFREALVLRRQIYGDEHPAVAMIAQNLATTLQRRGKLDEAESLLREAREVLIETLGRDHPVIATTSVNLAAVLHRRENHVAAQALYEEALAIRRVKLPAGHYLTGSALSDYGRCLSAAGRFDAGEAALLEAMETLESHKDEQSARWAAVLSRLAGLYTAWGRPAEAARYQASTDSTAA